MLSFDIAQPSPFSIELWVTSGCSYLYLISLCSYFSFLETLLLKKLSISIKWMENSFCNRKESVSWRIFQIFVPKWARSWSASDPSACSPSSSCRFWVSDHLCSNLSQLFHLCWITEIRSLNLCECFIFSFSAFTLLIEMNFSFKSLFAIWSFSPQRFH